MDLLLLKFLINAMFDFDIHVVNVPFLDGDCILSRWLSRIKLIFVLIFLIYTPSNADLIW